MPILGAPVRTTTIRAVAYDDVEIEVASFRVPATSPVGPLLLGEWDSGEVVLIAHYEHQPVLSVVRGILGTRAVPHSAFEGFAYGLANDAAWPDQGSNIIPWPPEPTAMSVFFNVRDYGAAGNGSNDDSAAIQATFDATGTAGGTVYFPAGIYNVTRGFLIPQKVSLLGDHSYWSLVRQMSGTATLFKMAPGGLTTTIQNLHLHGRGHCLDLTTSNNIAVMNCSLAPLLAGAWAIYMDEAIGAVFDYSLYNISVQGNGGSANIPTSYGIMMVGQGSARSINVTGCVDGIRACRLNNTIEHVRLEVNVNGLVLGQDNSGHTSALINSTIGDIQFESNNNSVVVVNAAKSSIGPLVISGGNATSCPGGTSAIHGLDLQNATDCDFHHITAHGSTPNQASIKFGFVDGCQFRHIGAGGGSVAWTAVPPLFGKPVADGGYGGNSYDQLFSDPIAWNPSETLTTDRIQKSIRVMSLQQLDCLNAAAQGRNLRQIAQSVTQTATSVAVAFQASAHDLALFMSFGADANVGGGLLVGGTTYYYRCSAVTSAGEAVGPGEISHTLSGGNNAITVNLFGPAGTYKFRIYRGVASGVYGGYYELAVGVTTYQDKGLAFTVTGAYPPDNIFDNHQQEPDTNYAVLATPNWGTTCWVTDKATTGFTVHFGTAAPASANVDWLIVR